MLRLDISRPSDLSRDYLDGMTAQEWCNWFRTLNWLYLPEKASRKMSDDNNYLPPPPENFLS